MDETNESCESLPSATTTPEVSTNTGIGAAGGVKVVRPIARIGSLLNPDAKAFHTRQSVKDELRVKVMGASLAASSLPVDTVIPQATNTNMGSIEILTPTTNGDPSPTFSQTQSQLIDLVTIVSLQVTELTKAAFSQTQEQVKLRRSFAQLISRTEKLEEYYRSVLFHNYLTSEAATREVWKENSGRKSESENEIHGNGCCGFQSRLKESPSQNNAATSTEDYLPGCVAEVEVANFTLNNQVPPGTRANNYLDNFRSHSRQNMFSVPKNVPFPNVSGNLESTRESFRRFDSFPGDTHRRNSQTRNSFAGEFVENIGTKMRNMEPQVSTSSSRTGTHTNVSPIVRPRSPPNPERDDVFTMMSTDSNESARCAKKKIGDVISSMDLFLRQNSQRKSYIISVFNKLSEIHSEAERIKVIQALTAIKNLSRGSGSGDDNGVVCNSTFMFQAANETMNKILKQNKDEMSFLSSAGSRFESSNTRRSQESTHLQGLDLRQPSHSNIDFEESEAELMGKFLQMSLHDETASTNGSFADTRYLVGNPSDNGYGCWHGGENDFFGEAKAPQSPALLPRCDTLYCMRNHPLASGSRNHFSFDLHGVDNFSKTLSSGQESSRTSRNGNMVYFGEKSPTVVHDIQLVETDEEDEDNMEYNSYKVYGGEAKRRQEKSDEEDF